MTSSATIPGKAFARIVLALAIAAMGMFAASTDPPGGAVVGFLLMLGCLRTRRASKRLPARTTALAWSAP